MVFVTGGAYQGKYTYIKANFNIDDSTILNCSELGGNLELSDIENFLIEKGMKSSCILNVHELIKCIVTNQNLACITDRDIGKCMTDVFERLLIQRPDILITMDEVGCGIVPIGKTDRVYREAVGFVGCFLAARADSVVRVISGIGQILKEHK